jgi:hypothetical protein
MIVREREEELFLLMEEGEKKLAAIRKAIQQGDRPLAVQLAAQRYELLKRVEELRNTSSVKKTPLQRARQ